ncbi:hypothetical protein [Actinoplanes sp. DH11]|uniref:hypothetical protein n=1 Tax=Actinoplanes sp. DH11 TaxID=2857011 RepID=UPI001E50E14B|nr:hypothetical protein [Actinoplanes sp. DH11]
MTSSTAFAARSSATAGSWVARPLAEGSPRAARRILRMRRAVALARAGRAFGEIDVQGSSTT